ncbi:MAG: IPT/TIG domain-containing protein [Cyanobacteria bacterium SZAS LIN-2]|nr:IPT/TIG domain-containing protein [Cyanobacteria bacterium SZAS LIN-2]MBS2008938.1 IPT/TIG domain-containing protein [Cyanobacteria bacterium SZAS TMP-1]
MRKLNRFSCLLSGLPLLLGAAFNNLMDPAFAADMAVVQQSRPYVARAGAWQTWTDHLHIKPGMERRNLVLTFINGAEGRAPMTDIKVQLDRKPFIVFKDFENKNELSRTISGTLKPGDAVVNVQGFGPSGARLMWQLMTDKVTVTGVKPNPFSPKDTVVIDGANFSDKASEVKVDVGGKHATVVSSTANQITIKPPQVSGGSQDVVVSAGGTKSAPFKVAALGQPHLTWVDVIAAPPSHPVVLSGSGFAPTPQENVVMFGTFPANVTSATDKRITCTVPMMDFPRWHVPITVSVHGVTSKEKRLINVDHRVIENRGIHQY